jgi:hypothetical protein
MNQRKKEYKNMNLDLCMGCGKGNSLRIVLIIILSCPQKGRDIKLTPKLPLQ